MTSPSPRSIAGNASGTVDATSFALTMGVHAAGDTPFAFIASDGNNAVLSCTGWTNFGAANSTTSKGHLFRRDTVCASSSEPNPTFISTAAEQYAGVVFVVPGSTLLNVEYAASSGSSGTPDAPNLNFAAGPIDPLLITFYAFDGSAGIATPPAGYGNELAVSNGTAQGCSAIAAYRTATGVSSENPGTATTTSEQWAAFTIAIYETPPAPPPSRGGTMSMMGV